MPAVTSADFRSELTRSAEETLHSQLSAFSQSLREGICKDVEQLLLAYKLLPSSAVFEPPTQIQNLPGKVVHAELGVLNSDNSGLGFPKGSKTGAEQPTEKLAVAPPPSLQNAAASKLASMDEEAIKSAKAGPDHAKNVLSMEQAVIKASVTEQAAATNKSKIRFLKTAVSAHGPAVTSTLRELDYFDHVRMKHAKSLDVMCATSNKQTQHARDVFLRVPEGKKDKDFAALLPTPITSEYELFVRGSRLTRVVSSRRFDSFVLFVITLSGIFAGIEAQIAVVEYSAPEPLAFKIIRSVFLAIFLIELGLRLFVFRAYFFKTELPYKTSNHSRSWNIFDCLVVICGVVEMVLVEAGYVKLSTDSVLRLLRLLRLSRLFRTVRMLNVITPLRVIMASIRHAALIYFWANVFLLLINYMMAVHLTALVAVELSVHDGNVDPQLIEFFGCLGRSQLSLAKAVTGGQDWGELERVLSEVDFLLATVPFFAYVSFTLIVTMNILTGIFLDSASQKVGEETELDALRAAHEVFRKSTANHVGSITKADFEESRRHPVVANFLQSIGFDEEQAEVFFELLDADGEGTVSFDEFLRGCLRLRGPAKALDLLVLSREVNQLFDGITEIAKAGATLTVANHRLLSRLVEDPSGSQSASHMPKHMSLP